LNRAEIGFSIETIGMMGLCYIDRGPERVSVARKGDVGQGTGNGAFGFSGVPPYVYALTFIAVCANTY